MGFPVVFAAVLCDSEETTRLAYRYLRDKG